MNVKLGFAAIAALGMSMTSGCLVVVEDECTFDSDCGSGEVCDAFGDCVLVAECTFDSDCFAGEVCNAFGNCVALGTPIYDTCGVVGECEGLADTCYATSIDYGDYVATNNTCSLFCTSDAQCPNGSTGEAGGCYDVSGDFVCYERCFNDADCPSSIDFVCADVAGSGGDSICIPR